MRNPETYPELLIPPFWGNSEVLNFETEGVPVRAVYSYFSAFCDSDALVVMDALEPGRSITEIPLTEKNRAVLERFRPDSDVIALCAAARDESGEKLPVDAAGEFLVRELRGGLSLPPLRGELLPLSRYRVIPTPALADLEREMTYRDRLGVDLPGDALRMEVYLFVHNAREIQDEHDE
ncbi:MAG: hypothetical protein ACQEQV_06385 [Fibrobacterota bacterium]